MSPYPEVLVAAVPVQWVGQAGAVLPPAVVDVQHHSAQAQGPLLQEPLAHRLQVAHHQLQDPAVAHVVEQEVVDVLAL